MSLGVSFAEVTITGNIDQAIASGKGVALGKDKVSATGLMAVWTPSWITFAGSEDLGDGLKANFKLENGLGLNGANLLAGNASTPSGADAPWNNVSSNNREAWVGVSGAFGNIQLGNQYSPVFNTAVGTDPNGANNVVGWLPFNVINGNKQLANTNAVTYTSPAFNGFTLQAQAIYGTKDTVPDNNLPASAGDGSAWSINYANGPFAAGIASGSNQLTDTLTTLSGPTTYGGTANGTNAGAIGDTVSTQVGALSYDAGMAKLSYLYTYATLNDDSVRVDTVGLTVPFGSFNFGYSASSGTTKSKTKTDVSSNGQQLGVYYSFSKRTTAYFSYDLAKDTNGGDNKTTGTAIGLRHSF